MHVPPEKTEVVACIDADFAMLMDMSSQLGVLVMVKVKMSRFVTINYLVF